MDGTVEAWERYLRERADTLKLESRRVGRRLPIMLAVTGVAFLTSVVFGILDPAGLDTTWDVSQHLMLLMLFFLAASAVLLNRREYLRKELDRVQDLIRPADTS